jgi:hypothetical protein
MLQSGVMTRDLDVQWVSSLSWYFLNLMGLQSVFGFILGSDNGKSCLQIGHTMISILANLILSCKPDGPAGGHGQPRCHDESHAAWSGPR